MPKWDEAVQLVKPGKGFFEPPSSDDAAEATGDVGARKRVKRRRKEVTFCEEDEILGGKSVDSSESTLFGNDGDLAESGESFGVIGSVALFSFMYFLEGIPYGIQADTLPIIYRGSQNYSLSVVTFSKISLVPWLLKPFLAKVLNSREDNVKVVKVALGLATVVAAAGALVHGDNYTHLLIIQFLLHTCIASLDIGVDYLQISDDASSSTAQFGLFKSIEVCFYKLGAFLAGALFITFSENLTHLYTYTAVLYALGFTIALIVFKKPQNSSNFSKNNLQKSSISKETGKTVRLRRHAKFIGFLLVQKLYGTAFRTLFPLFLVDSRLAKEYVATVTGTVPLIAGTLGSAAGGLLPRYFPEFSVRGILWTITGFVGVLAVPATLIFCEWVGTLYVFQKYLLMYSTVMVALLSFFGGMQTTLVFVQMAEIVKENPYKERINQLYCWLCSMEIIGKLTCGTVIGSVAQAWGYQSAMILCLFMQFFTVLLI